MKPIYDFVSGAVSYLFASQSSRGMRTCWAEEQGALAMNCVNEDKRKIALSETFRGWSWVGFLLRHTTTLLLVALMDCKQIIDTQ